MTFDPKLHGRRSIRIRDFDYSASGAYFVTLASHERRCVYGSIADDTVMLTKVGQIAQAEWLASGTIRQEVSLDAFVVMPNHLHAIVHLVRRESLHESNDGCDLAGNHRRSLASMIAGCKSAVTRIVKAQGLAASVWQRNYFERIIRNQDELVATRVYIADNPKNWSNDTENADKPRGASTARPYK